MRFHGISEKELKLSQWGKFKTKPYEVVICDFHLSNQLDLNNHRADPVFFGVAAINNLGFLS